jgi:hypothetical protein
MEAGDAHVEESNLKVAPARDVIPFSPLRFPRSMYLRDSIRSHESAKLDDTPSGEMYKSNHISREVHSLDLPQKLRAGKRCDRIVGEVKGSARQHQVCQRKRQA